MEKDLVGLDINEALSSLGYNYTQINDPKKSILYESLVKLYANTSLKKYFETGADLWCKIPENLAGFNIFRGDEARKKYREQWPAQIYILEDFTGAKFGFYSYEVDLKNQETPTMPQIENTVFGHDIYVFHYNLKWTLLKNHHEDSFDGTEPIFIERV